MCRQGKCSYSSSRTNGARPSCFGRYGFNARGVRERLGTSCRSHVVLSFWIQSDSFRISIRGVSISKTDAPLHSSLTVTWSIDTDICSLV